MLALAYQNLKDIEETPPLDEGDLECISEIRNVLKKYGKLDRLGINLLHTHFPIESDERLVEYCNDEARTLTMKVEKTSDVSAENIMETAWRLSDDKALLGCYMTCVFSTSHKLKHVTQEKASNST